MPEPGVDVSTYVRVSDYDKICKLALKHGVSMSSLVRDRLLRALREREREGE